MDHAHLGVRLGPVLLRLAGRGEVPVVTLEDAARALVLAAEIEAPDGVTVLNIVGDDLPDARGWIARMGDEAPRVVIPLPWQTLLPVARLLKRLNVPAPGLLREDTLRYRMAPRTWSNHRAKTMLGWQPEAMR